MSKTPRLSIRIKMALMAALDVAGATVDSDADAYHEDYVRDLNDAHAWVRSLVTPAEWDRWSEYAKSRRVYSSERDRIRAGGGGA